MKAFKLGLSVKAKHGIMFEYQKKNNLTLKEMARIIEVPCEWLGPIINLKRIPVLMTKYLHRLLSFFDCTYEQMFPTTKIRIFAGERAFFQDIPSDKMVDYTQEELNKLPAPAPDIIDVENLDSDIEVALNKLKPQEAIIIKRRFGIGCEKVSLLEIGETFGVSRERIRQIEAEALRKLRHPLIAPILKKYLIKED